MERFLSHDANNTGVEELISKAEIKNLFVFFLKPSSFKGADTCTNVMRMKKCIKWT